MLMVFLPVPADFVYSVPTPLLPLSVQYFYVTEGNIMYITDGFWFLISCVIQHYAPVVEWGGGGTGA